jgi:hypothetical protein
VSAIGSLRTRLERWFGLLAGAGGYVTAPPDAAARRRAWEEDGFVAGGPLLGAREVATLRAEFDRLLLEAGGPDHERIEVGPRREFHKVSHLTRRSPAFAEVARHPRLVALLSEITGLGAFRLVLDQVQYKPPRVGGRNAWHRDRPSFPLAPPYTGLTAWIALDDATVRTGCLWMVPGSHRWGDASDLAVEGDGWGLPGVADLTEYRGHPVRPVPRPVRAGHVHFHHERTWHASGRNGTRRKRRAIAIHYAGADDRYLANRWTTIEGLRDGDSLEGARPLVARAGAAPAAGPADSTT